MASFVTPRPVPQFHFVNTFSTKKDRRLPGQRKRAPPTPIVSAYYSCPGPRKAHTISFKSNSDSALISSPHYNLSKEATYFNQCFDVECNIGSGSFGDVFRVRSKEDGQLYAIKRSRLPYKGNCDRKEKLEEVRKMESLPHHPNCVRFYQAWEENQYLYIQLELCKASLSEITEKEHELPESTIWDYMIDLLLAIKHLHDNDLIHLDVKPENILLSMDGVCKLGDFGLVVNQKENLFDAVEGDSKYLAPEVLSAFFSEKADIFSLGITLLELACDLDLPPNGMLWHELRQGSLPEAITKRLSKELQGVLQAMMDPDPRVRPTASALLEQPLLRSRRRRRSLFLAGRKTQHWVRSSLAGCSVQRWLHSLWPLLLHLLLLVLLPIRALARKWRRSTGYNQPATPVRPPAPAPAPTAAVHYANYSFSDDEVCDISSSMSGNDSTLGRPLNDSSPLHNSSLDHRTEEQPVSSTPLVLRGGRSSRRSSLRRSIFSRPSRDHSHDDVDPATASGGVGCGGGGGAGNPSPSSASFHSSINKPIPRKLNDYFDAIASDSD